MNLGGVERRRQRFSRRGPHFTQSQSSDPATAGRTNSRGSRRDCQFREFASPQLGGPGPGGLNISRRSTWAALRAGWMHPRRPLQTMTACAQVCLQLSVSTVKRLLQIFGFALALVWVPITSHCSWESVIGGDFFKCAPVAENGDCSNDGDSCASVESASYKTPDAAPDVSVPSFSVILFQLPLISAPPARQVAPITAAPAEIPVRWQFVSRTALPPRAPSFVS